MIKHFFVCVSEMEIQTRKKRNQGKHSARVKKRKNQVQTQNSSLTLKGPEDYLIVVNNLKFAFLIVE